MMVMLFPVIKNSKKKKKKRQYNTKEMTDDKHGETTFKRYTHFLVLKNK